MLAVLDRLLKPVPVPRFAPFLPAPEPEPEFPLLAALEKLDIEPLKTRAVEIYKKYKLEREFELLQQSLRRQGWEFHSTYSMYFNDVRSALGMVWTKDDKYVWLMRRGNYPTCFAMGWHRTVVSLSDLKENKEIPEYVTRKAEAIQNSVPGATFQVDGLEDQTQEYDPFLVVRLGREEYYVEVWGTDERDYIRA